MKLSTTLIPSRFSTTHVLRIFSATVICVFFLFGESKAQNTIQSSIMPDYSLTFLEKLIQIAKENHPRPKVFENRIATAKTSLTREKINYIDILSFSFIYNPNYSFNILNPTYFQGIQVGVSFNMSTLLQKPLNVKRARLEVDAARLDKDEYMLTLVTQVKSAYANYIQASHAVQRAATDFNNSEDLWIATNERYQKSEITYDIWVQAKISRSGAAQSKESAEVAYLQAKASLEELLGGRPMEEIK